MFNLHICSVFLCQTPIYLNHNYFTGTLDENKSRSPNFNAVVKWQNDIFQLNIDLFLTTR